MNTVNQLLLIDDSDATNNFHTRLLGKLNFAKSIDTCSNGKEGLAFINDADTVPELIFLDLNMPVMDGFEFLEKINPILQEKSFEAPPIIILSSSEESVDQIRCKKAYPKAFFFSKPLTIVQINEITKIIT